MANYAAISNYYVLANRHRRPRRAPGGIPKVKDYVEEVIPRFTMDDFRNIFRLSRSGAEELLLKLSTCEEYDKAPGRPQVEPWKQLLLSLKYFGHQEGNRSLSQLFGVSVSSVSRIVDRFCDAMMVLAAEFIKWPTITEQQEIANGFSRISALPPFCVGAIDCRENPIQKPSHSPESFYNRKGFYSIKIQAICASDTRYLDVEAGWPGKSHDGRTFANSAIFPRLIDTSFLGHDFFLIGDSAYPNKSFLLTPYKDYGNLNETKRKFNREQSRARQTIECAFGRTVERFRRLKFLHVQTVEDGIKRCIVACALHNFCILQNEELFDTSFSGEEASHFFNIFSADVTGAERRDAIAMMIS